MLRFHKGTISTLSRQHVLHLAQSSEAEEGSNASGVETVAGRGNEDAE